MMKNHHCVDAFFFLYEFIIYIQVLQLHQGCKYNTRTGMPQEINTLIGDSDFTHLHN